MLHASRTMTALAAFVLTCGLVTAAPAADTPSGTVSLRSTSVAAGVWVRWGDGILIYKGKTYPFAVQGLEVLGMGYSEIKAEGTLPYFLLGNSAAAAVTLGDVIFFRDTRLAADPLLWAHELTHVEQYRRLGVETFAPQYLRQAWVLENEAIMKATTIKGHLAR